MFDWRWAAMASTALCIGVGCYPETFTSTSETDAILTIQNPDVDYAQNRTFAMTSTVIDLSDLVEDPIEIDGTLDPVILERVRKNFVDRGYQEIDINGAEEPDVGVLVGAVASNNWVIYYYPGWGPWYPAYPPVYYPPVSVPVNYATGTVVMTMVKVKDRDPETMEVQWFGAIDGLLGGGSNKQRVEARIDQAFTQSEYLRLP